MSRARRRPMRLRCRRLAGAPAQPPAAAPRIIGSSSCRVGTRASPSSATRLPERPHRGGRGAGADRAASREAPTLLLTVRASHLRRTPDRSAFRAGGIEADRCRCRRPPRCARRGEEIGIDAGAIEPIGFLSDQSSQPAIASRRWWRCCEPGFTLDARQHRSGRGVRAAAGVRAGGRQLPRRAPRRMRGLEFEIWELPFGERNIWGATAGILANLREVLERGAGVSAPARNSRRCWR